MQLPADDFIALSFINTKLRDEYPSLDAFCEDCEDSREDICRRMQKMGYEYCKNSNSFIRV